MGKEYEMGREIEGGEKRGSRRENGREKTMAEGFEIKLDCQVRTVSGLCDVNHSSSKA